jgi:hypothetical protein
MFRCAQKGQKPLFGKKKEFSQKYDVFAKPTNF